MKTRQLPTPLRYPGGKSKAVKKLFGHFPDLSQYQEYREPFIGGGSVALAVTKAHPDMNVWVNDLFWPVYNFWVNLRDNGEELSEMILKVKLENDTVDKTRVTFVECNDKIEDQSLPAIERAAALWIVNKCSFGGLIDRHSFSAGPAFSKNFSLNGIEDLKEYSKLIKNWKITNDSYETLLDAPMQNGFIYLDPPYDISCALYGKKGSHHKTFDHDLFAQHCRNHIGDFPIAISYNADDSVRTRYPDWKHIVFPLTYTMRSNSANYRQNQPKRDELLLVNY